MPSACLDGIVKLLMSRLACVCCVACDAQFSISLKMPSSKDCRWLTLREVKLAISSGLSNGSDKTSTTISGENSCNCGDISAWKYWPKPPTWDLVNQPWRAACADK